MAEELTKQERQTKLIALHETDHTMTATALAEELGVTIRTVQRDIVELKEQGLWSNVVTMSGAERLAALASDGVLDIDAAARRTLQNVEKDLDVLRDEMGFTQAKCPCCGRARLIEVADEKTGKRRLANDAMSWQALFKGTEALVKAIETLGRLMGRLESSAIIIKQADYDYQFIEHVLLNIQPLAMEIDGETGEAYFLNADGTVNVEKVSRALFVKIHEHVFAHNEARRRRTLGVEGIRDGTFLAFGDGT